MQDAMAFVHPHSFYLLHFQPIHASPFLIDDHMLQIGLNFYKPVKTCMKSFKLVKICLKQPKLVENCTNKPKLNIIPICYDIISAAIFIF